MLDKHVHGEPVTTMNSNSATGEVTLTCPIPVELSSSSSNPTAFWVVIPPTTFNEGITFTVHTSSGGVFERSSSASFTLGRNIIMEVPAMEVIPAEPQHNNEGYLNLSASETANSYIVSSTGKYCFDASVAGNGANGLLPYSVFPSTAYLEPDSVELLWSDSGSR